MTAGLWGGNEPGGAHGQQGAQARESGAAVPVPPASERDLVRLPGPRRHLDRLERDLRSGRSVDEARTAFIDLVPGLLRKEISLDYFREQARSQYQVKKQLPAAPLVELEVADLQRASRLLTLTTEQQRRLDILCDARNFLSHLQPLAHRQLMDVAQALISDWVADDVG